MGGEVINPSDISKDFVDRKNAIIILAMSQSNSGIVLRQLEAKKIVLGVDIFPYREWIEFYQYIFCAYVFNKVILPQCGIMAVYNCTLKCKYCIGAFPYFKNKKNVDWEVVKANIDTCFSYIDYVKSWGIGCGEAFLYSDLVKYISYCSENYGQSIETFTIDTNGTLLPNDEVLNVLKKYSCLVSISDYSTIPGWREKCDKLLELLQYHEISYNLVEADKWIDMGWTDNTKKEGSVNERFDTCGIPCRIIKNKRLYYCIQGMTANEALFGLDDNEDSVALFGNDLNIKRIIAEYNLGFNKKGYCKICEFCHGHIAINHKYIPVAEQL